MGGKAVKIGVIKQQKVYVPVDISGNAQFPLHNVRDRQIIPQPLNIGGGTYNPAASVDCGGKTQGHRIRKPASQMLPAIVLYTAGEG